MSCEHGNHQDACDMCDALEDAYNRGHAAGAGAWKSYALHQEWCHLCAESVACCETGTALRVAAAGGAHSLQMASALTPVITGSVSPVLASPQMAGGGKVTGAIGVAATDAYLSICPEGANPRALHAALEAAFAYQQAQR